MGCAGRTLDPANTLLDGNQTNTVLALSAPDVAAEFLVEGLTLRKGQPTSVNGGGLYARVGNDGAVTVNRNRIEKLYVHRRRLRCRYLRYHRHPRPQLPPS